MLGKPHGCMNLTGFWQVCADYSFVKVFTKRNVTVTIGSKLGKPPAWPVRLKVTLIRRFTTSHKSEFRKSCYAKADFD